MKNVKVLYWLVIKILFVSVAYGNWGKAILLKVQNPNCIGNQNVLSPWKGKIKDSDLTPEPCKDTSNQKST